MAGSGTGPLRLTVRDFTDLTRWRWTLTDESGAFLAGQAVRLDPQAERFEAFTDLDDYVSWHAAPDKRQADEARIITGLGDWIGMEVFGPAIGGALVARRPATVEVILPENAEALAYLPLEAARVQGRSLAAHDITFVIRPHAAPAPHREAPVSDRLRVLGLFSLPEGGSALNLRRERQSLVELIRGIAAAGRAADIRVLQYGVTRDRLRDILEEAEGWDIIHVSGHGTPGELVLETAAGTPDLIGASDLADLLDTARDRVKLVTLSACSSAALTANEQRRLLGLPVDEDQTDQPERIDPPPSPTESAPATLATVLTERLGCAVLAMRFPVGDEFAIALAGKLYDLLARQGQPLPRAVAMSLRHFIDSGQAFRFPALSMTAPAIFGPTATGLTLKAPDRPVPLSYAAETLKMADFPPQPARFVGRTAVMARASAVLAADSRVPGVLLHGMPGGGKTACALELAYTHEHAFDRLVWFKAPDEGTDITGALTDFALTLERDLPGFQMIHVLADDQKLTAFLPRLTELLERSRLLIVIDNAESLLTGIGQWRDPQWAKLFGALTSHTGLGRTVLTSRRVPSGAHGLRVEAVDALTADEALLLARELPHLRALIDGGLPGLDHDAARKLAVSVLTTAQGHPKLLELADGQAANPEQLAAITEAADQAWSDQGGLPDGFFTTGETNAGPSDYLQIVAVWTKSVTGTLSPSERDLFWFLCCLEESDRKRASVEIIWPHVWQKLGCTGQPPDLGQTLAKLVARGLISIRDEPGSENESYEVHPGVAANGRNYAGHDFQTIIGTEAGRFWAAVYWRASGEDGASSVDTELLVQAGLAAVPYLLRWKQWEAAAILLEDAFIHEPSRANAATMLPFITRIADHDPRREVTLAKVMRRFDPVAAETRLRKYLDTAVTEGDYRSAAGAANLLANLCRDTGKLDDALDLTDKEVRYTQQARLGPWSQLGAQGHRLQVLADMGRSEHILDDVNRLRRHMGTLPDRLSSDEISIPSNVREMLLSTGSEVACELGRWQEALDLNAEIMASKIARRASPDDIAGTQFGTYGPLLSLGRVDEALNLLLDCRRVFHDSGNIKMLGKTFGALSHTEHLRGHGDAALDFQRDSLRYAYLDGNVRDIAASCHNLGNCLAIHARQPEAAIAAHLATALISVLTGLGGTGPNSVVTSIFAAAVDLRVFGTAAEPPADIAELCRRLTDIEGVDFPALLKRLAPNTETAERALRDLIVESRKPAETSQSNTTSHHVASKVGRNQSCPCGSGKKYKKCCGAPATA